MQLNNRDKVVGETINSYIYVIVYKQWCVYHRWMGECIHAFSHDVAV